MVPTLASQSMMGMITSILPKEGKPMSMDQELPGLSRGIHT